MRSPSSTVCLLVFALVALVGCKSGPPAKPSWATIHHNAAAPQPHLVFVRPKITPIPPSVLVPCVDLGHGLIRDRPPSGPEYRAELRRIRALYRECADAKQTTDDWLLRIAGDARYGQ